MSVLAPAYAPRRPTETALYGLVREHVESFLRWARETYDKPLPRYVEHELRAYLRCGVFAYGFVRAHCDGCGHDLLVAFSCKGRAMCPSCAGRRMANMAAHLVDRVLPPVAVRQYVLSLPFELRALAAFNAKVLTALSRIFVDAIFAAYRKRAKKSGLADAPSGAVTFVQRFGSSLHLNVHFHVVVLDGVFTRDADGRVLFHDAPAPTTTELMAVVASVQKRALAWLRKRGFVREAPPEEHSNETPEKAALDACAEIALARGTYEKSRTEENNEDEKTPRERTSALGVERDGFNLHAGVFIGAHNDVGRERLCRYGARPPLALDRLRRLRDGRVAYRVKYARRGRAKHRVMTPLEVLARLAALIPPPRYPLVRYHGVLAPKSSWRKDVVPRPPVDVAASAKCDRKREDAGVKSAVAPADAPTHSPRAHKKHERRSRETIAATPALDENPPAPAALASQPRAAPVQGARAELLAPNILRVEHWDRLAGGALYAATPRIEWAKLLRRTFDVDVLECAKCSGRLRVLGAVNDRVEARAILTQLDIARDAPPVARARDPTDDYSDELWNDDE